MKKYVFPNGHGRGRSLEADSILEALDEAGVMSITPHPDGEFSVGESCDGFYSLTLNRDQFLALVDELRALAEPHGGSASS